MIDIKRLTLSRVVDVNGLAGHFSFGIQIRLFAVNKCLEADLFATAPPMVKRQTNIK